MWWRIFCLKAKRRYILYLSCQGSFVLLKQLNHQTWIWLIKYSSNLKITMHDVLLIFPLCFKIVLLTKVHRKLTQTKTRIDNDIVLSIFQRKICIVLFQVYIFVSFQFSFKLRILVTSFLKQRIRDYFVCKLSIRLSSS